MTFGPRTTTSPACPAGSSWSVSSTTPTSMPGSGEPDAARLAQAVRAGWPCSTTVHSDSPYPSTTGTPNRSSNSPISSRGIGAAPQMTKRRRPRVGRRARPGRQHRVDGGDRGEEGRPDPLHRGPEGGRVEPLGDERRAAGQQRGHHADHDPVDVEQRQHQQAARVGVISNQSTMIARRRADVRVVEHHALGPPGRAAGVDQQRERLRVGHQRGRRGRRAGPRSRRPDAMIRYGPSPSMAAPRRRRRPRAWRRRRRPGTGPPARSGPG